MERIKKNDLTLEKLQGKMRVDITMKILNPYHHAVRKKDKQKLEELKERVKELKIKYLNHLSVFEHQMAVMFNKKGVSL